MRHKNTFSTRLRYKFDKLMSKGSGALIFTLGVFSMLLIIIASIIIIISQLRPDGTFAEVSVFDALWESFTRAIDTGTGAGDIGWGYRTISLIITIGGIFIVSTLIGVLSSGITDKLNHLRKGKSLVIENEHTLILGWSEKIFTILLELIIANSNQKNPSIVILAPKDKVEMEDEIAAQIPHTKNTEIICRNGSPIELNDLEIVNPHTAKSIIILAPEEENPDIQVLKTLLALTKSPGRKKGKYHIVAEICDEKNVEIAETVGGDELSIVLSKELISKVIAQTCRQSGLSVVYTELLDFDGDEIYFESVSSLTGKTFKDSLFAFEKSCSIGLRNSNGKVVINPPMETMISPGDKIIAISEDDDTIKSSGLTEFKINSDAIEQTAQISKAAEDFLIIGWNVSGGALINELDSYVLKGSTITVASDFAEDKKEVDEVNNSLKNAQITFVEGNTTNKTFLTSLATGKYEHIVLLCYSDKFNIKIADAKALITLLHLRNIAEKNNLKFSIVSEILDVRDRELAESTKADDFIVSNKLISLLLSQLSENRELKFVFDDLFNSDGSEIYLKPASEYIVPNSTVNFYTILESAARKGHTAIGYRIAKHCYDVEKAYGVKINPLKSDEIFLTAEDKIIVLAED